VSVLLASQFFEMILQPGELVDVDEAVLAAAVEGFGDLGVTQQAIGGPVDVIDLVQRDESEVLLVGVNANDD
jgi:hypothetical protein